MLMNAVVAIVTLGVTPAGTVVAHGCSCGAPVALLELRLIQIRRVR